MPSYLTFNKQGLENNLLSRILYIKMLCLHLVYIYLHIQMLHQRAQGSIQGSFTDKILGSILAPTPLQCSPYCTMPIVSLPYFSRQNEAPGIRYFYFNFHNNRSSSWWFLTECLLLFYHYNYHHSQSQLVLPGDETSCPGVGWSKGDRASWTVESEHSSDDQIISPTEDRLID